MPATLELKYQIPHSEYQIRSETREGSQPPTCEQLEKTLGLFSNPSLRRPRPEAAIEQVLSIDNRCSMRAEHQALIERVSRALEQSRFMSPKRAAREAESNPVTTAPEANPKTQRNVSLYALSQD